MSASDTGVADGLPALGLGALEAGTAGEDAPGAGVPVAVGGVDAAGVDVQLATIAASAGMSARRHAPNEVVIER